MIGRKAAFPAIVEGRVVKYGDRPAILEDDSKNQWQLDLVDFYFPHLSDREGEVKWPRPFVYDENGTLIQKGIIFPVFFKNGNINNPVVMPFGKFTLQNDTATAESDGFDIYDLPYTTYESTKRQYHNASRQILHAENGQGDIEKRVLITSEDGSEIGQLNIKLSRAGELALSLTTQDEGQFAGKITLTADGDVQATIKGGLTVTITKDSQITISGNSVVNITGNASVNVGGDAAVEITGNATVDAGEDVTVNAGGNATVDAGGDGSIIAQGKITVDAPNVVLDSDEVDVGGPAAAISLVLGEALLSWLVVIPT